MPTDKSKLTRLRLDTWVGLLRARLSGGKSGAVRGSAAIPNHTYRQ